MMFLCSDDGSHFKPNKIPHKMTYGLASVQAQAAHTHVMRKGCKVIDLFTYTAAILNKLDLMSIMGFPGGINIDLL